jgi:DNA-binding PadR family transcriptional regulator
VNIDRKRIAAAAAGFLPLSPIAFEMLLTLAAREHHGYSMMLDIEGRTGGRIKAHAGTLYRALGRMLDAGLVEELDERPDPDLDDERRRYYRLTPLGREVAAAEAARLAAQVATARSRRLLKGPGRA